MFVVGVVCGGCPAFVAFCLGLWACGGVVCELDSVFVLLMLVFVFEFFWLGLAALLWGGCFLSRLWFLFFVWRV